MKTRRRKLLVQMEHKYINWSRKQNKNQIEYKELALANFLYSIEEVFMKIEGDKNRGVFKTVYHYAVNCRVKMLLSIISAMISVAGGFVPYLGVYQIIQLFWQGTPIMKDVLFWGGISALGYIVKLIFYGISTTLSHISAYQILENIRIAITTRLMKAPLGEVMGQPAGKLKNIIIDRVESIELALAHMIPEGISNLLLPIVVFGYLISINWVLALATLACIPLGAIVFAVMMRNYNEQYEKYMQSNNHVNSVIVEYVEGIEVIKAFNQGASSYGKYAGAVDSFKEFTLDWFRSTWKLMNLGGAILPSTLLGALPVGIYLYTAGALTPADLTMGIILGMSIIGPVSWFAPAVNNYKEIQYALRDANTLLSLPELKQNAVGKSPQEYSVCYKDVHFAYEESTGDVLHNINLSLPTGSFTALVGPSGGGKSTVARLLARFWDVGGGAISIGGTDIRNIPLEKLEEMITFVTQDNYLFNASLFENIRIGKPQATDAEVLNAAKAAQCEEFIKRLEHGWDTPAGEAGKQLSGGERQRIALARAILKDAPIIILDEATAFTDPENEARLQESISCLAKGKTLLVIAHRLSTITKADQIVVLEKGTIKSSGTHEELLTGCPLYREMWQAHIGAKKWNIKAVQPEMGGIKNV